VVVERETEVGMFEQALLRARSEGSVVVISGALGSGKSTLLHEFSEHATAIGARVMRAAAWLPERDLQHGVVRQLLDSARLDSGAPPKISDAASDGSPPGPRSLVKDLRDDQAVLIVVDDLQWTDQRSLRWLTRLAQGVRALPVVLVVAVRDGDPHAGPLIDEITAGARHTLRLKPLSAAGIRELVHEHFGEPGDDEFIRACHQNSDGNPLFVLPVLLGMVAAGVRPLAEHAGDVRSFRAPWLRNRLISELRSQPQPVREFAKALAILGDSADLDLIEQLAGLDSAYGAGAFDTLRRLGLLAHVAKPRFAHQTAQESAEMSMAVEEREDWHIRAAKLLDESGYSAREVAAQLLAITSPQDSWALEVLREAAVAALGQGDSELAARYLRRALLDTSPDGTDRAALLVELATVERGFDPVASVRHMSYALPLLQSPRERASAVVRLPPTLVGPAALPLRDLFAGVAGQLGEADKAVAADRDVALRLEARLRFLGSCDPAELAGAAGWLHDLGHEQQLLGSAAERELLVPLLHSAMLRSSMRADEVSAWANQILDHEPAGPAHVHTTLPLLMPVLCAAESVGKVSAWLDAAFEGASQPHATAERALIRAEQMFVLLHTGRLAEAQALTADVAPLATVDSIALVAMATLAVQTRDVALAERILFACQDRQVSECTAVVCHMLGSFAVAVRGDLPTALERFQDTGEQLKRRGWQNAPLFPWRLWAARLHARLGDVAAARDLAEEELAVARSWGTPCAVGRALRFLGGFSGDDQGIALLREAVTVLESSSNVLERARAWHLLGSRLRQGGKDEAATYLRESQRLATEIGVNWLAARARKDAGGETVPSPASAGRAGLTGAEYKVADLAAQGQTNSGIARELGVSSRAVEKHLTKTYRKLGIGSREQLREALRQK
jgi:DNA-binding CsgD family transcriptional regulator/predicted ATPase